MVSNKVSHFNRRKSQMKIKENWTEKDFNEMLWYKNPIHSLSFPKANLKLKLEINYFFKQEYSEVSGKQEFWISPCLLVFYNVLSLTINFDFQKKHGLEIESIKRTNPRVPHKERETVWDFTVKTNKGYMAFESTGFLQKVKHQPVLTGSQVLLNEEWE